MTKVHYVFKDGEKVSNSGFFDVGDAIEFAEIIGAEGVETAIWYDDISFENDEFADEIRITWEV